MSVQWESDVRRKDKHQHYRQVALSIEDKFSWLQQLLIDGGDVSYQSFRIPPGSLKDCIR